MQVQMQTRAAAMQMQAARAATLARRVRRELSGGLRNLSGNGEKKHRLQDAKELLLRRSQQMTAKLQSGRSRAWRHKWVFALVQADFVASAFCLGAWPERFYMYYTAQMAFIISSKVLDYGAKAQHYFLLDFCFFANLCILFWLWVQPTSGILFNAADGVCGLLAISVVIFRNSCVPHDFVRISNAYVHFPALVVMLSVKWRCKGAVCEGIEAGQAFPWYQRFAHAWGTYLLWALLYGSVNFVFARERIDRKKRDTLYKYFAFTLGYKDKLPRWWRTHSQVAFMLGHQSLFLAGIWWLFLPAALQAVCSIVAIVVFFHNGGRFYVDHFWKAYERNTQLYVDAAQSVLSEKERTGGDSPESRGAAEPPGDVAAEGELTPPSADDYHSPEVSDAEVED